jgi:hypothetical protein
LSTSTWRDGDRGHNNDHRQSPHGDSASSITPPEGHGEDNRGLHDIIHGRDAHGRIKIGSKIECVMNWNNAVRGTEITLAPTMTSLTSSIPLKEDTFQEASRPIPVT